MTETLAWQPVLQELLAGYENGLYTRLEVPSKAIDIISEDNFEALWHSLPNWVQRDILNHVPAFTENSEVVALGGGQPADVKRQLLLVKRLLIKHGIIDQAQLAELQ